MVFNGTINIACYSKPATRAGDFERLSAADLPDNIEAKLLEHFKVALQDKPLSTERVQIDSAISRGDYEGEDRINGFTGPNPIEFTVPNFEDEFEFQTMNGSPKYIFRVEFGAPEWVVSMVGGRRHRRKTTRRRKTARRKSHRRR